MTFPLVYASPGSRVSTVNSGESILPAPVTHAAGVILTCSPYLVSFPLPLKAQSFKKLKCVHRRVDFEKEKKIEMESLCGISLVGLGEAVQKSSKI